MNNLQWASVSIICQHSAYLFPSCCSDALFIHCVYAIDLWNVIKHLRTTPIAFNKLYPLFHRLHSNHQVFISCYSQQLAYFVCSYLISSQPLQWPTFPQGFIKLSSNLRREIEWHIRCYIYINATIIEPDTRHAWDVICCYLKMENTVYEYAGRLKGRIKDVIIQY